MKLLLYDYECKNCGTEFQSPQLVGIPYGEFLMRSDVSELGYLYALDDKVFDEFSQLIKTHKKMRNMADTKIAKIHHKLYGNICDQSPRGYFYHIGKKPNCPYCNSQNMSSWGPTSPPKAIELDIPKITYSVWNKMINENKLQLVNQLINKYLPTIC